MSEIRIDVDREAVLLDDVWYSGDELAAKLQQMLGNKDFRIGAAAQALEGLQVALAEVRDIGFRLSASMLDALETTAGREGRTTSAILRDALAAYLERGGASAGAAPASGVTVEAVSADEAGEAVPLTAKRKDGETESTWFQGGQS